MKKSSATLIVKQAIPQNRTRGGVAWLDPDAVTDLGTHTGDTLLIENSIKTLRTVVIVGKSFLGDKGEGMIRLDEWALANINTTIGEAVHVRKIKCGKATMVQLSPVLSCKVNNESYFAQLLENRAITQDDVVHFNLKGSIWDFLVVNYTPQSEAVIITGKTHVQVAWVSEAVSKAFRGGNLKVPVAKNLSLELLQTGVVVKNQHDFAQLLENKLISRGDVLPFNVGGRNLEFRVVDYDPGGPYVLIKPNTRIRLPNKEALEAWEKAVILKPNDAASWNNLGWARINMKDPKGAVEALEKALALDPTLFTAWFHLGIARLDLGNILGALDAYERGLDLNSKDTTVWNDVGCARSILKDFKGSIEALDIALTLDPKFVPAWCNLGFARTGLKDYKSAADAYENALVLAPTLAGAWNSLGIAYKALERVAEALYCYERSAALGDPDGEKNAGLLRFQGIQPREIKLPSPP